MTPKPKRKRQPQSANPLAYWWNEVIFSRAIDVETTLSPDECAERLRDLAEVRSYLNSRSVTAEVFLCDGATTFDVRLKHYNRGPLVTVVKAEGDLVPILDSGTRVHGTVKYGRGHYMNWLLAIVCLALIVIWLGDHLPEFILYALFSIIVMLYAYTLWLFSDRARLLNAVVDALADSAETPKRKRS